MIVMFSRIDDIICFVKKKDSSTFSFTYYYRQISSTYFEQFSQKYKVYL